MIPFDVSQAQPDEYGKLFDLEDRVAIVVNNAGVSNYQKLLECPPEMLERMIKTNVHPYIYMTKYAV